MNRSDLVRKVSRKRQLPRPQIETMLELFLEAIMEMLTSGEPLMLRNFGKFEIRERKAIVRKNPMTGEEIKVPAKRAILFHPAPAFKDTINGSGNRD